MCYFSAVSKNRLRYALYLHLALVALVLFRLSPAILVQFGVRPPPFLQRLQLPKPELWEFVWVASALAAFFGLIAMRKNRLALMQQCILGVAIFGLLPLFYAIYDMYDDLLAYWNTRLATRRFQGFPVVVLWSMFVCVALQVHAFSIYFAKQLTSAWSVRGERKAQ